MSQPKPHKHAALIFDLARIIADGRSEWFVVKEVNPDFPPFTWTATEGLKGLVGDNCRAGSEFSIVKTDKHPDNAKPAPMLDWSKVPVGAMTNRGIFLGLRGESFFTGPPNNVDSVCLAKFQEPILTPMTMWFDGQPTDEQRAMFDCEVRHVVDQMTGLFVQHGFWRIKGARK